jgi:PAS domain S-box-containing protein
MIGILSDSVLPPDLARERRKKISEVFTTRKPVRFTDENQGTWFDNVAYPIIDDKGEVGRIALIARDITDQKRAEAALQENENKYRTLTEASRDLIFLIGRDDRVEYVNSFAAEALGLPVDQVIGQKRSALFTGKMGEHQAQALQRVFETGIQGRSEGAMEILGTLHWFDHFLTPIKDVNGTVTSVLGVSRDITDRKQIEQALLESEARLRQITETLTSVFYIHERASDRFIYVSPAYEKIWKRSRQSLYDDPYSYLEAVHPEDKPRLLESIRKELEESRYLDTDYRIIQPDGTIRWIHSQNFPIFDSQGNVYRVAGTAEDITGRKAAEDAQKESEDRYRKLVEISPSVVLLHQDGKIIYANHALAGILGTDDAEELIGKNVLDLIHPAYREAIRTNIAQDLIGASTPFMELQMIRTDGTTVAVEGRGVGTMIGGKPAVLVAINDITERHRAGQARKEGG